MEKLRESQEAYTEATKKLSQVEADNNILMRQLQALMPDVSTSCVGPFVPDVSTVQCILTKTTPGPHA